MVDICGRVRARNQLPRRDTRRTRPAHLETEAGTLEGIRHTAPRENALVKLLAAELLGPGKAQNTGPTESAPLWSTQKPEPEWLRPGKCT